MKEYFINLFEYESWANMEILNSLLTVDDPPEKAMSIMSHIINARIVWISRMRTVTSNVKVWHLYSKSEIKETLKKSTDDLSEYLNTVSESEIKNIIDYTNTKGEKFSSSVKDILTHLIIHSSYHRGQIISLIKPLVQSLPYTDYIQFVRAEK